jgi:tricarballylate dehydrogenase
MKPVKSRESSIRAPNVKGCATRVGRNRALSACQFRKIGYALNAMRAFSVRSATDVSEGHMSQPRPEWAGLTWDVVVIGGGNAALAAALSAADAGRSVLVLERAPRHMRGGNTRHTRNLRTVHEQDRYNTGAYGFDELWSDLCGVGDGPNDEELARFTVRDSATLTHWMTAHGVLWQQPLAGTLHLGRTNRFFLGGGKALLNSYYRELATRPRVAVVYEAMVTGLEIDDRRCEAVRVLFGNSTHAVRARSVVCASGGFEANTEWLRRYWGAAADNYIIRGTPYNDGHLLACLYDAGAARSGQERGFHAIAVDARAPKFDGGIATRLDTIPFGIVVDDSGRRFYDEGEDVWPKRYASWGRHIAERPKQIAYSLWDSKVSELFLPPMYGWTRADSIRGVAAALGVDQDAVAATVAAFNAAVEAGSTFDPKRLDGCATAGLRPNKTNWAQPLDTPPYYGIAMRPGVTFTYMGVRINRHARVVHQDGEPFDNLFACGEIMSGNILSTGYLAGFGITIGTVWGRQAGAQAAAIGATSAKVRSTVRELGKR